MPDLTPVQRFVQHVEGLGEVGLANFLKRMHADPKTLADDVFDEIRDEDPKVIIERIRAMTAELRAVSERNSR